MEHIGGDNPIAALELDEAFEAAAARLATHPKIGRKGLIVGTREVFPHDNYRLVYEIEAGIVWILAVVHAARQWPPRPE